MTLEDLLASWQTSAWLTYERRFKVYVRKSRRYIDGKMYPALDIGNMSVPEKHHRKGYFTRFLTLLEATADERGDLVYIENILEPGIVGFLERRGYHYLTSTDPRIPCYYRWPKEKAPVE